MNKTVKRIELVDALRGFALLGIVLLHNVEYFDIANFVASHHPIITTVEKYVWDGVFFLFGGKCYPIFALMFGFSFYIQFNNRKERGENFAGRFFWRMCILFGFGIFHVMFYSGEILSCYAVAGMLIIPLRNLSNKMLFFLMLICMLEPWELLQLFYGMINPDFNILEYPGRFYANAVEAATQSNCLWEVIKTNISSGFINAHLFAWWSGRYFQTLSLFLAGILLGRTGMFTEKGCYSGFWRKMWFLSILCFIPLYIIKINPVISELRENISTPLSVMLNMWSNLVFTAFMISTFVLLWFRTNVRKIERVLIPFGKMSLSNYICSSLIGSFIYYKWGLGLYAYSGPLISLLTGLIIFTLLLLGDKWWLSRYRRGPLEWLWYKLTWIKK